MNNLKNTKLKSVPKLVILVSLIAFISCNQEQPIEPTNAPLVFPKGEKIVNDNFAGIAWLTSLVTADSVNFNAVGSVAFPSHWSNHIGTRWYRVLSGKRQT